MSKKKEEEIEAMSVGDKIIATVIVVVCAASIIMSTLALSAVKQEPEEPERPKIPKLSVHYREGQICYYEPWWNEKWHCLHDKIREVAQTQELFKRIKCLETGGHELSYYSTNEDNSVITFKCSKCDTYVYKKHSELTFEEKQALKELGIKKSLE